MEVSSETIEIDCMNQNTCVNKSARDKKDVEAGNKRIVAYLLIFPYDFPSIMELSIDLWEFYFMHLSFYDKIRVHKAKN